MTDGIMSADKHEEQAEEESAHIMDSGFRDEKKKPAIQTDTAEWDFSGTATGGTTTAVSNVDWDSSNSSLPTGYSIGYGGTETVQFTVT